MKKLLFISYMIVGLLASCTESHYEPKGLSPNTMNVNAKQKAIEALNQFREDITQSTQTRSLPQIDIKSINRKIYTISLSDNDKKQDSIDIYTIIFEKEGQSGYAILSPDERVGRMYAYTEKGQLNDTINNKALASYFNGISDICKDDLLSYKKQERTNNITKSNTRKLMVPNILNLEWNEIEPYNIKCPAICPKGNGHAYAGTGTIAIAQFLIHHRKRLLIRDSYSMNKPDLTTSASNVNIAFNYDLLASYPKITNSSPEAVKNEAAEFIYTVAKILDADFDCGGIGHETYTSLGDAGKVFDTFLIGGHSSFEHLKIRSILQVNIEDIVRNIGTRNPIIVQGISQYAALTLSWLYTGVKYVEENYAVKRIDELYINWGRGGESNGWFAYANNQGFLPTEVILEKSTWGGGSGALE